MQLALSADVLAPVGVGVLVAVLAVIALMIGLRRRADDMPSPTHDDWTGEHVGDAASSSPRPNPPTRTVADAVAARQIGTDPFAVVSPRAGAAEQVRNEHPVLDPVDATEVDGAPAAVNGARPVPAANGAPVRAAAGPEMRAMASSPGAGWAWRASPAGARPSAVAVADPAGAAGRPTTVGGSSVASTVVTDQARHSRPADDGEGHDAVPDPLPDAGSAGEVGSGGRSRLAGAVPQTRPGGPSFPNGTDHRAACATGNHVPPPGHGAGASQPSAKPGSPSAEAASSVGPSADDAAGGGRAEQQLPGAPGRTIPTGSARPTPDRSAEPAAEVGAPQPVERGPHAAEAQQASPESDGLDAWVATLPGVGPAEERLPTGEAESRPGARRTGDDRLEVGLGESLPDARRSADDRLDVGVGDSLPDARRPADDRPDVRAGEPLPNARRLADDPPDSASDECPSGRSVDHRSTAGGSEPASAAGSSQSVAAAVAQVLAARAAAHVPDADRRGEARDRLLAVLLDDPLRAVGATVDLQDCQARIDRLAATLNDERARLGDVLGRLAGAGLRPDQLARLSGLSDAEVAELLRRGLGA
jgi:hypothetical protein